ncbi:hypothetical protein F66182_7333 [Fusarium sp. NRRL 66182]|nr:hypothetical protein F66182_7333 [Fusarium sp. NRRL 66182]
MIEAVLLINMREATYTYRVAMDLKNAKNRSTSQTSLHSTYRAHETLSGTPRLRSPSQPRLPFQSLNETSALLRSPGPLESMLKTTTETGDIGVFSIKPSQSSSTRHHHTPRSTIDSRSAKRPAHPDTEGVEDCRVCDDRKFLPSNRDTNSELISLYGYPKLPLYYRSFSPSSDDGQRSQSLTTCSSRRVPSCNSSGTFQSQPSSGGLQRPRSPFPYPTRLKRPGVRPSSPAMSDNGFIDYSTMVEIDRASQRTTYGSYASRGRRSQRRYPPLSLRPEFSQSASSLPSRSSSGPYHNGLAPNSRTPSEMFYPSSRSPYRQPIAGDQSIRSASLTSIVEMYRGIPPNGTRQPLRSPGSFYYDYTEEFETETPDELDYTRPSYSFSDNSRGIRRSNLWGEGDIELTHRMHNSDEIGSEKIDSERPAAYSAQVECSSSVVPIDASKENPLLVRKGKGQDITACNAAPKFQRDDSTIPAAPIHGKRPWQVHEDDPMTESKAYRRHHRRNPANINTMVPDGLNLHEPRMTLHEKRANTAILSPNPISPAHQLRVTNSIPYLMKALPPLPDDSQHNPRLPHAVSPIEAEVSTRLLFSSSPANTAVLIECGERADLLSSKPVSCDSNSEQTSSHQAQSIPLRFKVRLKPSRSAKVRHKEKSLGPSGIVTRSSSNPIKPKLRVKVSRSRMSQKLLTQDGTLVRNVGLGQYNSLLELKSFPQKDVSTERSSFGEALEEQLTQLGTEKRLSNIDEPTICSHSRQVSDQFDIPYPPSTRDIVIASLVTQPKLEGETDVLGQERCPDEAADSKALRKKTSFLQPRYGIMAKGRKPKEIPTVRVGSSALFRSDVVRNSSLGDSIIAPSQLEDLAMPRRSHNKTRRVRRWASQAKRAVRSYVKRTLHRSRYLDG